MKWYRAQGLLGKKILDTSRPGDSNYSYNQLNYLGLDAGITVHC
jgi:hypothetical protein